jgi:hypothetical protein
VPKPPPRSPDDFHPESPELKYWDEFQEVRAIAYVPPDRPYTDREIDRLIEFTRFTRCTGIQLRALAALWLVRDPAWRSPVTEAMAACLRDQDYNVRGMAVLGLAKLRAREYAPLLEELAAVADERDRPTLEKCAAVLRRPDPVA